MPASNFDRLFEIAALELFQAYEQASDLTSFLQKRLPAKFGLTNGVIINASKETAPPSLVLFDALNCPKLFLKEDHSVALIPYNYVFGRITFIPQINQENLAKVLAQNYPIFKNTATKNTDNQPIIKPLNIWVAPDIATFITLDDLEDRLLAEENPPDLVLVLNRGLLITLNKKTIEQIFSLEQKSESQSFDKAITANLVDITKKTMTAKYFKMGASSEYKNLFYFYIFLINLLQHQALPEEELSAEMVAIWGR